MASLKKALELFERSQWNCIHMLPAWHSWLVLIAFDQRKIVNNRIIVAFERCGTYKCWKERLSSLEAPFWKESLEWFPHRRKHI